VSDELHYLVPHCFIEFQQRWILKSDLVRQNKKISVFWFLIFNIQNFFFKFCSYIKNLPRHTMSTVWSNYHEYSPAAFISKFQYYLLHLIFDWPCIISIYNKEEQSTRCNNRQLIKIPKLARHVSGNSYAHLQEHYTSYHKLYSTV